MTAHSNLPHVAAGEEVTSPGRPQAPTPGGPATRRARDLVDLVQFAEEYCGDRAEILTFGSGTAAGGRLDLHIYSTSHADARLVTQALAMALSPTEAEVQATPIRSSVIVERRVHWRGYTVSVSHAEDAAS